MLLNKYLKNVSLKGDQIISLLGSPMCLSQVLSQMENEGSGIKGELLLRPDGLKENAKSLGQESLPSKPDPNLRPLEI
jgi:hypothetical protein